MKERKERTEQISVVFVLEGRKEGRREGTKGENFRRFCFGRKERRKE